MLLSESCVKRGNSQGTIQRTVHILKIGPVEWKIGKKNSHIKRTADFCIYEELPS